MSETSKQSTTLSVSPMVEMSRAIRLTLERFTPHHADARLAALHTDVLSDFVQIVGAFYFDFKDELERRETSNQESGAE